MLKGENKYNDWSSFETWEASLFVSKLEENITFDLVFYDEKRINRIYFKV